MKEQILEWLKTHGFHYMPEPREDGTLLDPPLSIDEQRELMEHLRNYYKRDVIK